MNKNNYLLPKTCPNCDSKRLGFEGKRYIKCKDCAWMDDLNYYKKEGK